MDIGLRRDGRTPAIHSAEVEADTMADAVAASGLWGVERKRALLDRENAL